MNPSPQFSTRFEEPAVMQAALYTPSDLSAAISPDGKAISILFGKLQVKLSGSDPDTASQVATLRVPVSMKVPPDEIFLGYHVSLRGAVDKPGGARAVVFIELGGATKVIEFPHGTTVNDNFQENVFSFVLYETIQETLADGSNYTVTRTPPPFLTAVIVLCVQRSAPSDSVMLVVDSLDLEITGLRSLPKGEEEAA